LGCRLQFGVAEKGLLAIAKLQNQRHFLVSPYEQFKVLGLVPSVLV
jgi:hypothetical protein